MSSAPAQTAAPQNNPQPASRLAAVPWPVFLAVLGLGLLIGGYYWQTRLPKVITIAGGPEHGRYAAIAKELATELRERLGIKVVVATTMGSLENLQLLESRTADLGFYQPQTRQILESPPEKPATAAAVSFISNVYAEYLMPIGRTGGKLTELTAMTDRVWCCNDRLSGDYAMTRLLLEHLGTDDQLAEVRSVPYAEMAGRLADGNADVGVICCGLQAPILKQILTTGRSQLLPIPAVDALAEKHISLIRETIPAGFFSTSPLIPNRDFSTVAMQAQLLAGRDVSVRVVEEVTRILTDAEFQRRVQLSELFGGGAAYAVQRPEFEMHAGAEHIFYPDLKPLVNPEFVEGTEGLRSFIVSMGFAAWLLHRWWVRRQAISQEHRLDRYIRSLLRLELQQMDVDGLGGPEEGKVLQDLLDQVTRLRQEALAEFTAHELNEDRAAECFVGMCHALSDKVNGKLIRHCILQTRTL